MVCQINNGGHAAPPVATRGFGEPDPGHLVGVPAAGREPDIGLLVFDKSPLDYIPASRLRAMAAEAALQETRLLLFCAEDCDIASGTIAASSWLGGAWRRVHVALPSLVMIVTTPIRPRHDAVAQWVRAQARFVEDRGLDKLALAQLLGETALRRHVIPYEALPQADVVQVLAHRLGTRGDSVVKPVNGKRGSGIHMLHGDAAGRWTVRKDDELVRCDTAVDAAAHVARRIAGRMHYRSFLAQDYVPSRSRDGRSADFRVHVQRGGAGRWTITRAYVRLGEAGRATSNVSRGAFQGPCESLLAHRGRPVATLQAEMEELAVRLAVTVDAACERPLSELGIDLMIDQQDQFWIVEANARPQTSLHEHARAVNTIAYALHLARGAPLLPGAVTSTAGLCPAC